MNKSDFFTADAVKPHFTYDDYCESADMIASHLGDFRPEVLLVLGSGLGFLGDRVEGAHLRELCGHPALPRVHRAGPRGPLCFRRAARQARGGHAGPHALLRGLHDGGRRLRLPRHPLTRRKDDDRDERRGRGEHRLPSRRPDAHFRSHQAFRLWPALGPNIDEFGTRFPDMSNVYSPRLRELAKEVARSRTSRCARASTCTSPARSSERPPRCALRACSARTPWACPPCRRPSPPRTAGMRSSA